MITAYKKMLQNWNNFSGRTSRRDYWFAILGNVLIVFGIEIVFGILGLVLGLVNEDLGAVVAVLCAVVLGIYSLALLVPSLAIAVRRLHDIGKPGTTYLICFLLSLCCGIGSIVFFVFMCLPSVPGSNQWGPNPYGIGGTSYNGYNTAQNPQYGQQFNQYGAQNPQYGQPNNQYGQQNNQQNNW